MHESSLHHWQHSHQFLGASHQENERRTWMVVGLTAVMMVVEITAGSLLGSMALFAEGWHMGTHVGALGITTLAYLFARRNMITATYSFGTGKVGDLAGFTSALLLALVSAFIAYVSVVRLFAPVSIAFNEAIAIAVMGLLVNVASAFLLKDNHHDHAHHGEHHDHQAAKHEQADHNLRSAYVHVLADGVTSALAIIALMTGKVFGWGWMDPLMGIVGSLVIGRWSYGLLRDTSRVLLDVQGNPRLVSDIRTAIETDADNRVTDLHLWRVGPGHFAAIVSLVTHQPRPAEHYKKLIGNKSQLGHVTVEVNTCYPS